MTTDSRGVAMLDILIPVGVGGTLLLTQAVVERITAVDLLTGIVLAISLFLLRGQISMSATLHGIEERLTHVPTKKETSDEIQETRHLLRGEMQGTYLGLDERISNLEDGRR